MYFHLATFLLIKYNPKNWNRYWASTYGNVQGSIIHNSQEVKMEYTSISGRMAEQNEVCPCSGVLSNYKNKWSRDVWYNVDESQALGLRCSVHNGFWGAKHIFIVQGSLMTMLGTLCGGKNQAELTVFKANSLPHTISPASYQFFF